MDGQAAVLALVDRRHQPQRRVEAEQLPPLLLAPRDGDVDAELAHRLEHPDLGRFAARLAVRSGASSARDAGGGGAAEEAEHGIGRDRRREPPSCSRSTSPSGVQTRSRAHPVLGQRAGLVGADHGRRAERLDRAQPLDERAAARELGDADRERERDRRQQPLGHVGDDQPDREAERVVEREPGREPADRQERDPDDDGDERDQPRDPAHLRLERARLGLDPLDSAAIRPSSVCIPVAKTSAVASRRRRSCR